MDVEGKASELDVHLTLLGAQEEADHTDTVLSTVLVQQLSVPLVHLEVLMEVLEHYHSIAAFVQVRQDWQRLARHFNFVPTNIHREMT